MPEPELPTSRRKTWSDLPGFALAVVREHSTTGTSRVNRALDIMWWMAAEIEACPAILRECGALELAAGLAATQPEVLLNSAGLVRHLISTLTDAASCGKALDVVLLRSE